MISLRPTMDMLASATITFDNMRPYYDHYSVDWELITICNQISDLNNWDILDDKKCIGAVRLAFDDDGCYLRDFQVRDEYQNRGIGTIVLKEIKQLALTKGASYLRLRVFKISPAYQLYMRNGFRVSSEDERFYYMSQSLINS
ncbi:TPA: GNAT family N-acetyltransferase [Photobacterium damselae]|uniref:GNAT family N-acetyltransferase n=1 Tax=Photobacterium damselae TaxID=38293 RepID=A0ACD3T4U0_PHODM|nr:GNAT family N-acetyltransferase [Photobacterium damselae]MCG3823903.1 GNAT family N-acetyltransferase [Photobacterium damselae]RDL29547.1 GCN5 family acetyltransferase [Photobacterium damselae]TMX54156.1 GNAT family N-acetyltransferase [Photobacterium damselae]TMX69890.1 GNAT family N-acetyltransferase [Photobacterium damselae]TMX77747.1 GNAT family N-acetyltransferase [Photobacterium damselae]